MDGLDPGVDRAGSPRSPTAKTLFRLASGRPEAIHVTSGSRTAAPRGGQGARRPGEGRLGFGHATRAPAASTMRVSTAWWRRYASSISMPRPGPSGIVTHPASNWSGSTGGAAVRVVVDAVLRWSSSEAGDSVRVGQAGQDQAAAAIPIALFDVCGMAGIEWTAASSAIHSVSGDAAADDRFGLDDVDSPRARGRSRGLLSRISPPASAISRARGEPVVALVASALMDRFLEPDEPESVQDRAHLDGTREGVAGIPVGHHLEVVGNVVADLLEQSRLVGDRIPAHPPLHGGEPGGADPLHLGRPGQLGSFPSMYPPLRRVGADHGASAHRTTPRPRHRAGERAGPRARCSRPRPRRGAPATSGHRATGRDVAGRPADRNRPGGLDDRGYPAAGRSRPSRRDRRHR